MFSDSLTLPFPNPSVSAPSWLRQPLRWLSLDPRSSHPSQSPSGDQPALRFEKHLIRNARRQRQIVLGTPQVPYEPLVLGDAPLAALRRFEGLAILLATRSSEILEQLDVLIELDCVHAVTVDVLVASFEPGSADLEERLRTISALSSQGITTRLLLTDLSDRRMSSSTRADLWQLFEAASQHRAFDVGIASGGDNDSLGWARWIRGLRLEFGFPRPIAGRG